MRSAIRPGFGLPGGKVGVMNGISVTVKCLIFSEDGLLIVKEKNPQNKSREERIKSVLPPKEIRHRIWKAVARRREVGSPLVDEEVLKRLFEDIENSGEEFCISLSAVREILEETGLLIRPQQLTRLLVVPGNLPHYVVLCLGKVVSGKLRKESGETLNYFMSLSNLPPTDGEVEAEKMMKTDLMFYRHKVWYIPTALKILLEKNFNFPFSKDEVENFLKNKIPSS